MATTTTCWTRAAHLVTEIYDALTSEKRNLWFLAHVQKPSDYNGEGRIRGVAFSSYPFPQSKLVAIDFRLALEHARQLGDESRPRVNRYIAHKNLSMLAAYSRILEIAEIPHITLREGNSRYGWPYILAATGVNGNGEQQILQAFVKAELTRPNQCLRVVFCSQRDSLKIFAVTVVAIE